MHEGLNPISGDAEMSRALSQKTLGLNANYEAE